MSTSVENWPPRLSQSKLFHSTQDVRSKRMAKSQAKRNSMAKMLNDVSEAELDRSINLD